LRPNSQRRIQCLSEKLETITLLSNGRKKSVRLFARLTLISSAKSHVNEDELDPFLWGSARVNADLALAAHGELEGTVNTHDELEDNSSASLYQLINSAMFSRLRDAFIEEAEKGSRLSFARAMWRAYNAGLMSPDRFIQPTNPN
jgi:hypothetical protein